MIPEEPPGQGDLGAWVLASVLVLVILALSATPQQMRPAVLAAPPKEVQQLVAAEGYDPVATYNPQDRILTITSHLPADALVCIGAKCGLVREWERAVPEHWKGGGQ